jgi:hypothetical protein
VHPPNVLLLRGHGVQVVELDLERDPLPFAPATIAGSARGQSILARANLSGLSPVRISTVEADFTLGRV